MPTLAGWLTGEQVAQEIIEQVLTAMGEVLGRHGGEEARSLHPGAGLIAFADAAFAMTRNDEPSVLDWVPERRTLVYRRPLSGWHPLYYITDWPAPGNLLFASEIKALFAVGAPRRIHLAALDALQRYGFIPAPWTFFQDIQIVPAGSLLRWQRAKTVLNHATDYRFDRAISNEALLAPDTLLKQFIDVSQSLLPPHNQIVSLTGGDLASALTTFLAHQQSPTTFPVATLSDKKSLRAKIWQGGEQVAQACDSPFLAVSAIDQPEYWTATLGGLETPCVDSRPLALHQLFHTVASETGARVAMTGLGARIVLNEPGWHSNPSSLTVEPTNMLLQYQRALTTQYTAFTQTLWSPEVAQALQHVEQWETTLHAQKIIRRASQFATSDQSLYYLDLHLRLPDLAVHHAYQLATQERLALRSLYLHSDLLHTLTHTHTLTDGTPRQAIPQTLLQQLQVTISQTAEQALLSVPQSSLSKLHEAELVRQVLSSETIRAKGIFNVQTVENLLHQAKKGIVSRELLLVFTTQLLSELFDTQL